MDADSRLTAGPIDIATEQAMLDPAELSKGLEDLTAADARDELARRVAMRTPFSLDVALPIVAKALSDSKDDVLRAAQQISSQLAQPTFWSDRREAAQKLADSAAQLSKDMLAGIDKSSRWTLLSIATMFGFLMAVAPYALLVFKGRFAETTPEYLVTSLSGGAVAIAGLIGIVISDRGATQAAKEFHKDAVEAMRDALA